MTTFYRLDCTDSAVRVRAASDLGRVARSLRLGGGSFGASWERVPFNATEEGALPDFLANDLRLPLCSLKMRGAIDWAASDVDSIEWLPVMVRQKVATRPYFLLHLPFSKSVVDEATFAANGPVRSGAGSRVYGVAGATRSAETFLIAEEVHEALVRATCTGCTYRPL